MKNQLFIVLIFCGVVATLTSCNKTSSVNQGISDYVTIQKDSLMDKIKGGWAGQTIGCTFGGPTEFRYQGTMIGDYTPIDWPKGQIKWYYDYAPGLYDDVYMDLTFVDVFNRLGLDAPVDSFAVAFANARYQLWHANQQARYNILNGIMPPESGSWKNNAHADDIDYQIEADFSGLMSPGMPNVATEIGEKIGHIMNYGDGLYGGLYVGAMYSLAFISTDIYYIVTEALNVIPAESRYHQCMSDVIKWYLKYPDDWKQTWAEVQKHYAEDKMCPDGVFAPFNIDAVVNSAYIVIGLLYGERDFSKTLDISTRCGQDSDCNPASAAGILGTILGYSHIPEYWKENLYEVEDRDFAYTTISLNKVYRMSFNQALENIERNGGKVNDKDVIIKVQKSNSVPLEQGCENMYPIQKRSIEKEVGDMGDFTFDGNGVMLNVTVNAKRNDYVALVEIYLDGKLTETRKLPVDFHDRTAELYWNPQIPMDKHTLTFKWVNPEDGATVKCGHGIVYSNKPYINPYK